MARPKDQTARRAHLMTATLEAIRRHGVASLRIKDVAEAAGVSTGTVHYYFDDLDQLLLEVHTAASDRFYADRLAAIAELDDARDRLTTMVGSGLPTSRDDAMVVALYEIDVHKLGDPVHTLLYRGLYDRQVALYHGILELGRSQGHFAFDAPVLDVAQNMVALEDAYGLHVISGNRSLPVDRCAELIAGYARTATGCPDIAARTGS